MSLKNHWPTSLPPFFRDPFVPFGTENDAHPPLNPPTITASTQVPEDTVDKIIRNPPIKSCLLDPWPKLLFRNVVIYYYHHL